MNLFKDFNFLMIHRIREILLLLKNHLNYLEGNVLECFLRIIIKVLPF